jgi:hypothetical protein
MMRGGCVYDDEDDEKKRMSEMIYGGSALFKYGDGTGKDRERLER